MAGKAPPSTNMENLLDIDFDGSAPASLQKQPISGESGLEGLAGTPQRVASPGTAATAQPQSTMDDLLGLFGDGGGAGAGVGASGVPIGNDDLMNGFSDMSIQNQPPPATQQLSGEPSKKSNQDLLDLF